MRFFKKEGNVKYKKSDDEKYIEGLIKEGWEEVNSDGSLVGKSKSKSETKSKEE